MKTRASKLQLNTMSNSVKTSSYEHYEKNQSIHFAITDIIEDLHGMYKKSVVYRETIKVI